jgi:hypothetical protein
MEPSPLARPPREAVAPCALRLMETGGQTAREALPAHFTRRWERASLAERFRAGKPTLGWPACLFPRPGIVSPNASIQSHEAAMRATGLTTNRSK